MPQRAIFKPELSRITGKASSVNGYDREVVIEVGESVSTIQIDPDATILNHEEVDGFLYQSFLLLEDIEEGMSLEVLVGVGNSSSHILVTPGEHDEIQSP